MFPGYAAMQFPGNIDETRPSAVRVLCDALAHLRVLYEYAENTMRNVTGNARVVLCRLLLVNSVLWPQRGPATERM